ncbi:hypothetical protein [Usitatibacter rugosus]|nr:hypothetical protein [Usitatibacter rugosus]
MTNYRLLLKLSLVAGYLLVPGGPAAAADPVKPPAKPAMTLELGGTAYLHRWTKNNEHEFTPQNDADLQKWHDMVTLKVYEQATTPEKIAELANRMLTVYRANGKVLKTASRPRTVDRPAEHLIVAMFGSPDALEAAFVRLMFVDGAGLAVVYSHRVYGSPAGPAMSKWLETDGGDAERALMEWKQLPKAAALKKLPVSP